MNSTREGRDCPASHAATVAVYFAMYVALRRFFAPPRMTFLVQLWLYASTTAAAAMAAGVIASRLPF